MLSVSQTYKTDLREKGSKFLGILFPVWEDGAFETALAEQRREHYDATHHCSACIRFARPNREEAHDDGEPAGTAGLPILNAMRSAQLVNAGLIVIRYFGGTKLGKAGLIEAYGATASECVATARLKPVRAATRLRIQARYDQIKTLEWIFSKSPVERLKSEFLDRVSLTVQTGDDDLAMLQGQLDQVAYTGISYEVLGSGLVMEAET